MVGGVGDRVYSWNAQNLAETQCYPQPQEEDLPTSSSMPWPQPAPQNQCLFFRGFKITLNRFRLNPFRPQAVELSHTRDKGFNPRPQSWVPFTRNAQSRLELPSVSSTGLFRARAADNCGVQIHPIVGALESKDCNKWNSGGKTNGGY